MNVNKEFKRGLGLWKFNNTLLQDECYFQLIKDCYPHILQKYANVDDKQLLWELIKMEIRSETIRYSKGKSKELDSKICNEVCLDQNILSEYEKLKKELQEIYKERQRSYLQI